MNTTRLTSFKKSEKWEKIESVSSPWASRPIWGWGIRWWGQKWSRTKISRCNPNLYAFFPPFASTGPLLVFCSSNCHSKFLNKAIEGLPPWGPSDKRQRGMQTKPGNGLLLILKAKNVQKWSKMSKMSSAGPRFSFKSRLHLEIFVLDHFWPHHWISHHQVSLEAQGLENNSYLVIFERSYIVYEYYTTNIFQKKWKMRKNWVGLQSLGL